MGYIEGIACCFSCFCVERDAFGKTSGCRAMMSCVLDEQDFREISRVRKFIFQDLGWIVKEDCDTLMFGSHAQYEIGFALGQIRTFGEGDLLLEVS
jgi:hypothetical protein